MNKDFKVSYYVRTNKANKEGKFAIMLRVSLDAVWLTVGATGLCVSNPLKFRNNRLFGRRSIEGEQINGDLNQIELRLKVIFHKLENSGVPYTLTDIKEEFLAKENKNRLLLFSSFSSFFLEKEAERLNAQDISSCTYNKYCNTLKNFEDFLRLNYHLSDIALSNITPSMMEDFQHYLVTFLGCSLNTTNRKIKHFKTFILQAKKRNLLPTDPFVDFQMVRGTTNREFLTEEELERLSHTPISLTHLSVTRDVFLFACFTGLCYSEVASLCANNIVFMDDREWIMTVRKKTKLPSNVPLVPFAKSILRKYTVKGMSEDQPLLPLISNQKTNLYLKKIAAMCGINKSLTFHMARHTFATYTLTKGVSMESVSKMLGHSNLRTTQIYAKITNPKIKEDMALFASKIEGSFSHI